MTNEDDLKPHVIILLDYVPAAICMTKHVAESMAARAYKPGSYTVRLATEKDIKCVMESHFLQNIN